MLGLPLLLLPHGIYGLLHHCSQFLCCSLERLLLELPWSQPFTCFLLATWPRPSPAPPGSRLLAPDRPLPAPSRPPAQASPGASPPPGLSRSPGHSQYTGQLCNTSVYASISLSHTSHPSGAYGPVVMGAPRSSSCGGPAASSHPIPSGTDGKPVYKAGSDPLLGIL